MPQGQALGVYRLPHFLVLFLCPELAVKMSFLSFPLLSLCPPFAALLPNVMEPYLSGKQMEADAVSKFLSVTLELRTSSTQDE